MQRIEPLAFDGWSGRRIDVRGVDEYLGRRLPGVESVPMERVLAEAGKWDPSAPLLLVCKTGVRSQEAATSLARAGFTNLSVIEGGLDACEKAGLELIRERAPIPIIRQTLLAAGLLMLLGLVLGFTVHHGFFAIDWFIGAGLTFAGLSGTCPMSKLLAVMPWNQRIACSSSQ